jgi:DNA-binding GntR family transcriptional regulator
MTAGEAGPTVGRRMLADEVYERLLEFLMDGRLPAGAPASIDRLARDLSVSQTPVREALARLEATGLVHRVALKGYRVAPPFTPDELGKLMEARRVIEPANAGMAAVRVTDRFRADMDDAMAELRSAPRGPSFAEIRPYWRADERFHRLIAAQADNPFLLHAFESLGGLVQRFRLYSGTGVTDADRSIAEHDAVLAALKDRDPQAAAAAMEQHIVHVGERALRDRFERVEPEQVGGRRSRPLTSLSVSPSGPG